jgi:hypothetical protein
MAVFLSLSERLGSSVLTHGLVKLGVFVPANFSFQMFDDGENSWRHCAIVMAREQHSPLEA